MKIKPREWLRLSWADRMRKLWEATQRGNAG